MLRSTTDNGSPMPTLFPENAAGQNVTPPVNYPVHKYSRYPTYRACPPVITYNHMFGNCASRLINFRTPLEIRDAPMPRYWRAGYIPTVYTSSWDPRMRLTAYQILLKWIRTAPINREKGIFYWLWEAKKEGAEPGMVPFNWLASVYFRRGGWEKLEQWLVERIGLEKGNVKLQDLVFGQNANFHELSDESKYPKLDDMVMDEDMEEVWEDFASSGLSKGGSTGYVSCPEVSEFREIDDIRELDELDWSEFVQLSQKRTGVGYDLDLKARLDYSLSYQIDDGDETDDYTVDEDVLCK